MGPLYRDCSGSGLAEPVRAPSCSAYHHLCGTAGCQLTNTFGKTATHAWPLPPDQTKASGDLQPPC